VGITEYEWGGEDLWAGADCSGFVQGVLRSFGVALPRTAAQQYRHRRGTPVSRSELRPGDLVFFCCTYAEEGITHVGIYAAGGTFVHAASEGEGVKRSRLSDPFYRKRFVGGKRYYSAK
jgi:cell wall-associated NlpC family hydrolase